MLQRPNLYLRHFFLQSLILLSNPFTPLCWGPRLYQVSSLTWPWDRCCIAGNSLLCKGLVAECCPMLQGWFVVLRSRVDMGKHVWATFPFILYECRNSYSLLLGFLGLRDPCQHFLKAQSCALLEVNYARKNPGIWWILNCGPLKREYYVANILPLS